MRRHLSAVLALGATLSLAPGPARAAPAAGVGSTPADQARFLAGLPVDPASPLRPLTEGPEWRDHQQAMDQAWPRLEERLARAGSWQAGALVPPVRRDLNVIYLFGGPDAAHAVRLFPEAPAFLLAGLESVGAVQAPEAMKPADVHAAIDGLAAALRTFIDKSFFRTSEMGHDLRGKGISGVLPVLYLFLARSGAEVLESTAFEVGADGVARDLAAGAPRRGGVPGVRVRFQLPGRAPQEMSYVRVNLLDEELARQPGFLAWAGRFAPANGLLKAASFILHDKAFSRPRAFLMEACQAILQDDSGIPYRVYRKAGWGLACHGAYLRPRDPFQSHHQPELAEACAAQTGPLDFVIGYRRASDSALQLYVKGGAAPPSMATALLPVAAPPAILVAPWDPGAPPDRPAPLLVP